jgi:hypothetical protein
MKILVAVLIGTTLLALSALHVYWAAGGKTPGAAVIPEVSGHRVFEPTRLTTVAVAVALACAALVVLARGGLFGLSFPAAPIAWACGLVGVAFVLRAVGEFRLVGFFKSVDGTQFAAMDTWLYSPLCLVLGLGALWLAFAGGNLKAPVQP